MNSKHHRFARTFHSPTVAQVSNFALLLSLLIGAALPRALAAATVDDYVFVYPNGEAEWATSADFNGDGLLDAVIVDRATGAYRIGYQSPGGTHDWTAPRASGIAGVSGFSVGYLLNGLTHGMAFTAEAANRVNVVSAANSAQAGVPVSVYLPSVGPNQVVAVDVGGAGNTALHDLVVPSAWNGLAPFRTSTIRNLDGASFATIDDSPAAELWERGNRVVIKSETTPVLAIMARGTTDSLRLISYAGGPAETFLQITNLPAGSDYAVGRFSGTGLSHFLVFRPGQSNLWAYPVLEPVPGTFEFGAADGFAFDEPVESVVTLPGAADTKLLVFFDQGSHAAVYDYDGTNAPVLVGEFLAPEGESLLGATPLENNGVRIHSGTGSRTRQSLQYTFNSGAGTYSLDHVDVLPPVTDLSGLANVFQFQFEPFVVSTPKLLSSGHAGDWSSVFSLGGGPPQVGVLSEDFVDATHGLDNPTPADLGASHPLTQFGLVNQYQDFLSLFSLTPGPGDEVVEVSAQPPGGLHARSVAVSFVVGSPAFQVLYRLNPNGAWLIYAGKPVLIFTNSVLQYRAHALLGTAQTSIHSEAYQFKEGPGGLDSDGDGVPDYIEIAHGLDPVKSGSDGDGDGYSDLDELLEGTSPTNASSHPAAPGYEEHAAVDLVLTPRPLDGLTDSETVSRVGPHVRVFDMSGSELGAAPVGDPPDVPLAASALVSNVFINPRHELLVVATEPHFDVETPAADSRIGRELVRLIPCPEVAPIEVNYQFGGAAGVLNSEAQNWVAAAQAAYGSATNEVRFHTLPVTGTTTAVLLEEKLRRALADASPMKTNLTLFSFRPGDAGRMKFDDDARALLAHADPVRPAYDLKQLYESLETMVVLAPNAQVQSLNAVAHEIYRVSSAFNNDAPGQYRLPLEAIRGFIRDGVIQSNYLAAGTFPAPLLADATAGVQFVLDNLGSRPVTNLTLRVLPDSFAGPCTTLAMAGPTANKVNLFEVGGGAFDFPDTFHLLPGSIVQVVGRPDVSSTTCAGLNVEVLSILLAAIPASSDGDADGNLLIDSWENLLLGMIGSDPFGDDDGDGYSNLQEMFEGTDPHDGLGVPSVPMASLALPVLNIEASAGGEARLDWFWPEAYLNKVQFQILSTPDLNLPPTLQPIQATHQGGGVFEAVIPNQGGEAQFFKVVLQLHF
jgi:Bacterial TSP3 repeat